MCTLALIYFYIPTVYSDRWKATWRIWKSVEEKTNLCLRSDLWVKKFPHTPFCAPQNFYTPSGAGLPHFMCFYHDGDRLKNPQEGWLKDDPEGTPAFGKGVRIIIAYNLINDKHFNGSGCHPCGRGRGKKSTKRSAHSFVQLKWWRTDGSCIPTLTPYRLFLALLLLEI